MIAQQEDPVIFETTATLFEWHKIWTSLFLDNQMEMFDKIGTIILELIDLRGNLISLAKKPDATGCNSPNDQEIVALKNEIINKIDSGNRLLDLDLVPRDRSPTNNYKPVDPVFISPIRLFQLHLEAASTTQHQQLESSSLNFLANPSDDTYSTASTNHVYQDLIYNNSIGNGSISSASSIYSDFTTTSNSTSLSNNNPHPINSHHIQLSLKNHHLAALPDDLVEIFFSVVDVQANNNSGSNLPLIPITEKFLIQIKGDETVNSVPNTIFTNVGNPLNNNRDICLYVQVYRVGKMILVDGYKTNFTKQQSSGSIQGTNSSTTLNGSNNSVNYNNKFSSNVMNRYSTSGPISSTPKYRRPFGTALIPLKEYIKSASFKETFMTTKILAANESEFCQVQDLYSRRNLTLKNNQNLANIQLDLGLRFICCPQESILRISNLCVTEKRGFPDIVMPGDFKNDLFFTLESAEFEKGGKSIPKNIEASISLIDKTGLVIENCISPASNCDKVSSHNTCVFYHSNSPRWNDSIKINVPLSEFDGAHVRIEFKHCSTKDREKKFLGFSFLPLSDEDGTVIADKSHELYLYKCDPQLWEDEPSSLCKYTNMPYGPNANAQSININNNGNNSKTSLQNNFNHSNREIVTVNTFLLSTKLTQNSDLLNLLKWRELIKRNNKDFEEALNKVLVLKGEEIVKFLQDILDTLFDTFTLYSTKEDDYSALIFKVLIHIFLLLEEPKYQHFKPVLDLYASAHFSATLVYKGLLACVKKCLEYSSIVECHSQIKRCFKSIKHVFQFIVQSKLLYSKATGEHNDEPFLNDLRHLFKLFELMLANNNPNLIPIKVTFLESFPGALDQLIKVVSAQELTRVMISLAGCVVFRLPPALSRAKLIFMKETANSVLVRNQDMRLIITENFCKHLDYYLKHSEELELCHEVLEILITKIHDSYWPCIHRFYQLSSKSSSIESNVGTMATVGEINFNPIGPTNQLHQLVAGASKELAPLTNILDPLLNLLDLLVRDINNDRLLVQKYCTCFLTILKLMGKSNFDQYMKRRKDYTKLSDLFKSLRAIYHRNWSMMQLTSHSIMEHPIEEFYKDVRLSSDSNQLSSYIKLIVDFITHPTLQLETFSVKKKHCVLTVFGDLRLKFSAQLIRFWKTLTKSNIYDMIPTSIQPILDAALLPNDEIQQTLIPILYDMIDSEYQLKSNSRQIERCLIDDLDLFLNLDRGGLKFVENFEVILTNLIEMREPEWNAHTNGINLIKSFSRLMRLLIDYRSSLEISENRGKQMSCLVELLNYYKEQDRTDLHVRYLFKLCDMHVEVGNYVEAAFCLKLYADELRWCSRNLSPIDGFRLEELERHRKEALYLRMIQYFDLGKCWEEAISLCKELASFYEINLVDYEKVSITFKRLALFLDNILTEHRPEREYFKVEYIGSELPDYVRNKEFVFRGGEYERLAAFIQRMNKEFPKAQVLNSKTRQTITKDSPGQYMIISNLKAVPFLQEHFKSGQRIINDKIIHYYLNNRIDTFSYDKPIIKDSIQIPTESSEMNVKNLWIGRYLLKTRKQLPDILPWVEIVSQDYMEISPINHAIETISNMNLELTKLILSYTTEPNKQISPLTMRLQGVIEAAVNGGPSVFVNAFLKHKPGETVDSQLEPPELTARLHELIKQQYSILEQGLNLHFKLAPPEVMPLHARLVERLKSAR